MSPEARAASAIQWSWNWSPGVSGNGSARSATSRRNSVAAPVTVLATSSDVRSVWLVRLPCQSVSRSTRPSASTRRWSEYDEPRAAERATQHRELVGRPAVVLVAQRQQRRLGGREAQRPLEVAVEAEPALRPRHVEARVVADLLAHRRVARGARAVVADHAHPVAVGLRAQGVQLRSQQRAVGLEGRHADRDEPAGRGARPAHVVGGGRDRHAPERDDGLPSPPRAHRQRDVDPLGAGRACSGTMPQKPLRNDRRSGRRPGLRGPEDVGPRHRRRGRPEAPPVDEQLGPCDLLAPVEAVAVAEDRGGAPGRQGRRQRGLQPGHEVGVGVHGARTYPPAR